jgi:hypothetical protein
MPNIASAHLSDIKPTLSLKGQWRGFYNGTNAGSIVVDVDDMIDHFEGVAHIFSESPGMPASFVNFRTENKDWNVPFDAPVKPFNPINAHFLDKSQLPSMYPGLIFPDRAHVNIKLSMNFLTISWTTNIGTQGHARLPRSAANLKSRTPIIKNVRNWNDFKSFASSLEPNKFIFRGQDVTNRLRTAFHRNNRFNIQRLSNIDIPVLHRHLSGRTRHVFDLSKPTDNGAFYNLVQHHGYPTPLLDWTYSPFVAAYFAFRRYRSSAESQSALVRIYVFDKARWVEKHTQLQSIFLTYPHFSILEALGIENERMIPQQALSTLTTIDDIETYIQSIERLQNYNYLRAIDLPKDIGNCARRELAMMGLTAGSLFPGIDGACEELRDRFFS